MSDRNYSLGPGIVKEIEDQIYISLIDSNSLLKIDAQTGIVNYIDFFKNEKSEHQLHFQIVNYKNKLLFVPWNAENMAIYDLDNNELRYVLINNDGKSGRFVAGIQNGKYLYLVLENAKEIIQFDMDTEKIVDNYKIGDLYEEDLIPWLVRPVKTDKYIWNISGSKDKTWKFDFTNHQYVIIDNLFEHEIQLIAGCIGDDSIWVISDNDIVYQLSTECEYIDQYNISGIMSQIYDENEKMALCAFLNDMLIVIFHNIQCLIKIPVIDDTLEVDKYQYQKFKNATFFVESDKIVVMENDEIIIIDDKGERRFILSIPKDFFGNMMEKNKYCLNEDSRCGINLNNYIEYICNKNDLLSNITEHNKLIGQIISDTILGG